MSFDLMVFEPGAAPKERVAFMKWYEAQTEWTEDHGYDDPRVSSPALQRWYAEMVQHFPPLNGPLANDSDDPKVTDYSVGRDVIYAAFAWSLVDEAYDRMRELAIRHDVGFFHASDLEGEILFPGGMTLARAKKPWWRFW